jgi:hypothetical protein
MHDLPPVRPTPQLHLVKHDGACGERIPSPHPRCQARTAPYLAAELCRPKLTSAGTVRAALIHCHGCGMTWQGSEATS